MKLSIVIAAFNEEKTILSVLEHDSHVKIPNVEIEVLVINDGSSDNTQRLLSDNPHLYHRVIHRKLNGGKGAAVRDGLRTATGDYVVFQDADFEYDPSELCEIIKPVLNHNADMVLGSRFLGLRYTRVHYFWNEVGNRLLTLIFNLLFNQTFTDIYTCYLVFRKNLVNPDELVTNGFQQQAEILCCLVKRSKIMFEVALQGYNGRTVVEGKKIRALHALLVFWEIFKGRFLINIKPLPTPEKNASTINETYQRASNS